MYIVHVLIVCFNRSIILARLSACFLNFFLDKKLQKNQGYSPRRPTICSAAKRLNSPTAQTAPPRFTLLSQGGYPPFCGHDAGIAMRRQELLCLVVALPGGISPKCGGAPVRRKGGREMESVRRTIFPFSP